MSDSSSDELDLPGSRPNIALPKRRTVNLSSSSSSDDIGETVSKGPAVNEPRRKVPLPSMPAKAQPKSAHAPSAAPQARAVVAAVATSSASSSRSSSGVAFEEEEEHAAAAPAEAEPTPDVAVASTPPASADGAPPATRDAPKVEAASPDPRRAPCDSREGVALADASPAETASPSVRSPAAVTARPTALPRAPEAETAAATPTPAVQPAENVATTNASARPVTRTPSHQPHQDNILERAEERLQRRASRPASRASTPTRGASRARSQVDVPSVEETSALEASRDRLLRENVRLMDEVKFLLAEREKSNGAAARGAAAEQALGIAEKELTLLRRKYEDSQRDAARQRALLEQRLKHASDLTAQLQDELDTSRTAVTRMEAMLADKERALSAETAVSASLRADLRDVSHEMNNLRSDAAREREEDSSRIEQLSAMLADAKKQRLVLLDLNDKCVRDKEHADAERRSAEDRLQSAVSAHSAALRRVEQELASALNRETALKTEKERNGSAATRATEELQRQLEQYRRRLDEIESTKESQVVKAQEEHEKAMAETAAENSALRQEVVKLSSVVEATQVENRELIHRLENADTELQRLKQSAASNTSLQAVADEQTRRIATLEAAAEESRQELDALRGRLKKETEQRVQAQEDSVRTEARYATLRAAMDKLLASDDQLADENEQLIQKVTALEIEIEDLTYRLQEAETRSQLMSELQAENSRLQVQVTRSHADRVEMSREIDRMRADARIPWNSSVADSTPVRLPGHDLSTI